MVTRGEVADLFDRVQKIYPIILSAMGLLQVYFSDFVGVNGGGSFR